MADALRHEIRKSGPREPVELEPASLFKDLRTASLPVRAGFSFGLAALAAYFSWFGLLAVGGVWRGSLLSPIQIGVVTAALSIQGVLGWLLRAKPMAAGLIWAALWMVPACIFVVSSATANDYRDAALFVLSPIILCLLYGFYFGRLSSHLEVPAKRGE